MLVEIVGALWEREKFNGTESNNSSNNLSPAAIGVVVTGLLCTAGVLLYYMKGLPSPCTCPENQGYADEHHHLSSSVLAINTPQDENIEIVGSAYIPLQDSDQT